MSDSTGNGLDGSDRRIVSKTLETTCPNVSCLPACFHVSKKSRTTAHREKRSGVSKAAVANIVSLTHVCIYFILFGNNRKQETKRSLPGVMGVSKLVVVFPNRETCLVRAVLSMTTYRKVWLVENDFHYQSESGWIPPMWTRRVLVRDVGLGADALAGLRSRLISMTAPLIPGQPGKSEFNWGKGRFPNPLSDYQSQRNLAAPQIEDKMSDVRRFQADLRTDPTDPTSGGYDDNIFLQGNPDTFGPGPAMVKEPVERPATQHPQPVFRTGVDRQG